MSRRVLSRAAVLAPMAVLALTVLGTRDALAWDSICYQFDDPTRPVAQLGTPSGRGCEGVLAARGRWRDPEHWLDEHRIIMRRAMKVAGLPDALLETIVLKVPTSRCRVDSGGAVGSVPTLSPEPLDYVNVVNRLEPRGFALDELAQLPDFSYSLADWADGNEKCPLPELVSSAFGSPAACHTFKTHMGAHNASHFPPQSDSWYRWMHNLALARADECRAMRAGAWGSSSGSGEAQGFDTLWKPFWQQCEAEALALEAVAQHYLQDSWSAGHMWERWGSGTLADFPVTLSANTDATGTSWNGLSSEGRQLAIAELIAVFSGTIHGSDPSAFEAGLSSWYVPSSTRDALCYPADDGIAYQDGTSTVPVAGDMHLHDALGDPLSSELFGQSAESLHSHYDSSVQSGTHTPSAMLATQRDKLTGCSASSVRQVYDRLTDAASYGNPTFGATSGTAPTPPASCDAPRVTSLAFSRGVDGEWWTQNVDYDIAESNGAFIVPIPSDIKNRALFSYDRVRKIAGLLSKKDPTGTHAARLRWEEPIEYLEEIHITTPSGESVWQTYPNIEPPGELRFLDVGANSQYAVTGGRPTAYADPQLPWGDAQQPGALAENSPEQALASTFHRAHAPLWCARTDSTELSALEARTKAASPSHKANLCEVCVEVVSRHVRPASSGKSLCDALHPGSAFVEGDGTPTQVAEERCGCVPKLPTISKSCTGYTSPVIWDFFDSACRDNPEENFFASGDMYCQVVTGAPLGSSKMVAASWETVCTYGSPICAGVSPPYTPPASPEHPNGTGYSLCWGYNSNTDTWGVYDGGWSTIYVDKTTTACPTGYVLNGSICDLELWPTPVGPACGP